MPEAVLPPDDPIVRALGEPGEVFFATALIAIEWQDRRMKTVSDADLHEEAESARRSLLVTDRRLIILPTNNIDAGTAHLLEHVRGVAIVFAPSSFSRVAKMLRVEVWSFETGWAEKKWVGPRAAVKEFRRILRRQVIRATTKMRLGEAER